MLSSNTWKNKSDMTEKESDKLQQSLQLDDFGRIRVLAAADYDASQQLTENSRDFLSGFWLSPCSSR